MTEDGTPPSAQLVVNDQPPWGRLFETCGYGENPYMTPAGLYTTDTGYPLAFSKYEQIAGKPIGAVGFTDHTWLTQVITHLAAGFALNFGSAPFIAVAVKHGNACGAAVGDDPADVLHKMATGDELALFGGVVMTNFPITEELAHVLATPTDPEKFTRLYDGIYAPSVSPEALEQLERKTGKCRVFVNPALEHLTADSLDTTPRRVQGAGGEYLLQPNYTFVLDVFESQVNGGTALLEQYMDIVMAWAIGCVSNSNTIAITRGGQLLALAVGQQSRVLACELAVMKLTMAGHNALDAVAYSDSFFPYEDAPVVLAKAGISTLFASSGAVRDKQVIAAFLEAGGRVLLMQPDVDARGFGKH